MSGQDVFSVLWAVKAFERAECFMKQIKDIHTHSGLAPTPSACILPPVPADQHCLLSSSLPQKNPAFVNHSHGADDDSL